MLEDFLTRFDHGFQDGGCAIMAQAIVLWSKRRLSLASVALIDHPLRVQHVVATDGVVLLDSDGLASPEDMVLKLDRVEGRPGCFVMQGYDPGIHPNIPWSEEETRTLSRILATALPEPVTLPWMEVEVQAHST